MQAFTVYYMHIVTRDLRDYYRHVAIVGNVAIYTWYTSTSTVVHFRYPTYQLVDGNSKDRRKGTIVHMCGEFGPSIYPYLRRYLSRSSYKLVLVRGTYKRRPVHRRWALAEYSYYS